MTPLEEVHQAKAARLAKLAADKARYTRLAEFHKKEADHYLGKSLILIATGLFSAAGLVRRRFNH
jgi:hypothetical protein